MRALVARAGESAPVLTEIDPTPPGPSDVRIQVASAAVNPIDVFIAGGPGRQVFGLPDQVGLGWDVAGTITAVGSDVRDLTVGDRVAALDNTLGAPGRTHAESVTVPAANVARVPDGLDLVEAGSLPLNALTARQAVDLLGTPDGRSLLITGAAGAVGGFAAALAARDGWTVSALVRSSADAEFVTAAGAHRVVTDPPGPDYDVVLDAAALQQAALGFVRDGGRFVGVQPALPVPAERGIDVGAVGVRPDGAGLAALLRLAVEGALEVRVAGTLPLADAASAYAKVAGGGQRGRWLLVP